MPAIEVDNLGYSVQPHFWSKRRALLSGVTFTVQGGEIFGFLGPNGAGKTTTIKILLGLMRPDTGEARIGGHPSHRPEARARLGFLPERAYYPAHFTARELVLQHAVLAGAGLAEARRRAAEVLERTGLAPHADARLATFSKGMLQRAGLAQALVGDPDIVILDEPMSGLDPLGRRDVRQIMAALKDAGKTVFFSTHILPDVELICDRVAILVGGRVQRVGTLEALTGREAGTLSVSTAPLDPAVLAAVAPLSRVHATGADGVHFEVDGVPQANHLIDALRSRGAVIRALQPRGGSLEDLFVHEAKL
ncbi:MAG TPA: ABC transporter ATP-binding protein [Myxococcota bacterium]|nr:ABC transporter ATP-binding protein [Myxococcota bacterium]